MEKNLLLFLPPENCSFVVENFPCENFSGCSQELPAFALCSFPTQHVLGIERLNKELQCLIIQLLWDVAAAAGSAWLGLLSGSSVMCELRAQCQPHRGQPGQGSGVTPCGLRWLGRSLSLTGKHWGPLVISICCWNSGCHTQSFRPGAWIHYSSIQTCPVSPEPLPPVPVSPGTAAL